MEIGRSLCYNGIAWFSKTTNRKGENMKIPTIRDLFDLSHTKARSWMEQTDFGYEIIEDIPKIVKAVCRFLGNDYEQVSEGVFIAKDAKISPLATILGPTVIGHNTEVRPGAYIRGAALIGDNCVIGNSTEIKNAILFDKVQVPHYNYVGDSILGYRAHMGAGSILSNVRADRGEVKQRCDEQTIPTGRKKVGALLGDRAEIGCGAVLCPGVIVGRDSVIYPLALVRGTVKEGCIYKSESSIVEKV